jgi:hypothetical protein
LFVTEKKVIEKKGKLQFTLKLEFSERLENIKLAKFQIVFNLACDNRIISLEIFF